MKKEKKIFDAITNVDDTLIEQIAKTKKSEKKVKNKKTKAWIRWSAIAACLALIIAAIPIINNHIKENKITVENGILYAPITGKSLKKVVYPESISFEDYEKKAEVFKNNPVDDSFMESTASFAYMTGSEILGKSSENTNYSPLSLYYALAIAAYGAQGKTSDEMLSILGVSDKEFLSTQCSNLYNLIYTDNKLGKLKIANSLWMSNSFHFKDKFVSTAAEKFYASSFNVNFSDKKTSDYMADWIYKNTNGKFKPELQIDPDQMLSIINTIYFYDEWADRFDKNKTKEDKFYLSNGDEVNCDFMNSSYASGPFKVGNGFKSATLGLKNGGWMTFILPDKGVSPQELLSTPQKMQETLEGGEQKFGEVIWQIPKFSFKSKFDLANTIKKLGVTSAFGKIADFSSISDQASFISNITQETYIGIDENGVEASAYTELDYTGSAMPEDNAEMILNRPFIYAITSSTGSLLFVGVCENPLE